MPSTVTATMSTLIDETLNLMYRDGERPLPVHLGSNGLANASDTELTLTNAAEWDSVNVGDVLELVTEKMLVTAKSGAATPVFTVQRGYAGSTAPATAYTSGQVMYLNPLWPRWDIFTTIRRYVSGGLGLYLPNRTIQEKTRTADKGWVALDANTLKVHQVFYVDDNTGNRVWLDNWHYEPDMATSLVASGKALTGISQVVPTTQTLYITTSTPYQWATGGDLPADETDTVDLLYGAHDLIPIYAAAYVLTGRELTRHEIDRTEEWNQEAAIRQGVNVRMVREMWGWYFRRLDELMKVHTTIPVRPYRRRTVIA